MAFEKFVNVQTSVKKSNFHDLSSQTITSLDFFKLKPIWSCETVPNCTYNMDRIVANVKLMPLQKPILSSCRVINRFFFVPYRTVFKGWQDFYMMTPYVSDGTTPPVNITAAPYCSNNDLVEAILSTVDSVGNYLLVQTSTSSDYDIRVWDNVSSSLKYYKWTLKGKHLYDIMLSLGMKVIFPLTADERTFLDNNECISPYALMPYGTNDGTPVSLMPLLAFAKVWYDWYSSSVYINKDEVAEVLNIEPKTYNRYGADVIRLLLRNITNIVFDEDYFTSAFDRVTGQVSASPQITIPDQTEHSINSDATYGKVKTADSDFDGPHAGNEDPNEPLHFLTQFMNDALHRVTDFIKRMQLAGNRVVDRYAAEFDIDLSPAELNRSLYLGKQSVPINISTVTANTESGDNQVLGSFAGQGFAFDADGKFTFKATESGLLIVTSYVDAKYCNPFGKKRRFLHIKRPDFFQGDFDGLGMQAIRKDELFCNNDLLAPGDFEFKDGDAPNDVFGFTSRYAEYKNSHELDIVSGDFMMRRSFNGLRSWFMFRNILEDVENESSIPVHSLDFTLANGQQFDQIFANNSGYYDNFICLFLFDFKVNGPIEKMWNDYKFESDEYRKARNIQINGTTLSD